MSGAARDPADLARAARTRMRRFDRLALTMCLTAPVLGLGIGIYAARADGSRGTPSPGSIALMGLVLLVLLGLPVAAVAYRRRRVGDPALVVGADRSTRKAVQRALRTGHTQDPHVDALTRDAAEKTLRMAWVRWVFLGALILSGLGLTLQVLGGVAWWRGALSALLVASTTFVGGSLALNVRRSRRYLLAGGPPESERHPESGRRPELG